MRMASPGFDTQTRGRPGGLLATDGKGSAGRGGSATDRSAGEGVAVHGRIVERGERLGGG